MEKITDKQGPGRPKTVNPKSHLPRVRVYGTTIEEMAKIADQKGRTLSAVYQEALDIYIRMEKNKNIFVTL